MNKDFLTEFACWSDSGQLQQARRDRSPRFRKRRPERLQFKTRGVTSPTPKKFIQLGFIVWRHVRFRSSLYPELGEEWDTDKYKNRLGSPISATHGP